MVLHARLTLHCHTQTQDMLVKISLTVFWLDIESIKNITNVCPIEEYIIIIGLLRE